MIPITVACYLQSFDISIQVAFFQRNTVRKLSFFNILLVKNDIETGHRSRFAILSTKKTKAKQTLQFPTFFKRPFLTGKELSSISEPAFNPFPLKKLAFLWKKRSY